MPINDGPIHLKKSSVELPVTLFQDHIDGLCALIHYCAGASGNGAGTIPGSFELIMHYRLIAAAVRNQSSESGGAND